MSKELEICKITFKLSLNAFDFCENMASIGVGKISSQHHEMKKYHQQAIMILDNKRTSEKTKHSKLSSLLRQMEMLAGTPTPKFPKGGIHNGKIEDVFISDGEKAINIKDFATRK